MKTIKLLYKDNTRPTHPLQEVAGKYSLEYVKKYIRANYFIAVYNSNTLIALFPFYNPTTENIMKVVKILSGNKLYKNQLIKTCEFMGIEVQ